MIHVAISVSSVKAATGKIVGASIIARDIDERVRAEKERDTLFRKLQASLAEVQLLSGLLPICAWCERIRNEVGCWRPWEQYIREHSEAEFTHGFCPECVSKFDPQAAA